MTKETSFKRKAKAILFFCLIWVILIGAALKPISSFSMGDTLYTGSLFTVNASTTSAAGGLVVIYPQIIENHQRFRPALKKGVCMSSSAKKSKKPERSLEKIAQGNTDLPPPMSSGALQVSQDTALTPHEVGPVAPIPAPRSLKKNQVEDIAQKYRLVCLLEKGISPRIALDRLQIKRSQRWAKDLYKKFQKQSLVLCNFSF